MNKIFKKKDVIFKQGENATCMYEVHIGSVGIYSGYGTDQEKLLTELKSGTFFGEMGLIDQMPRSAAAVVLEDHTEITVISQDNFQNYLKDHPEKVMEIMQHMSGRIRNLTNNYLDACRAVSEALESEKNGKERICSALCPCQSCIFDCFCCFVCAKCKKIISNRNSLQ